MKRFVRFALALILILGIPLGLIVGCQGQVIPVAMSRTLAAQQKDIVRLVEIPGARHNTIQSQNSEQMSDALREVGR